MTDQNADVAAAQAFRDTLIRLTAGQTPKAASADGVGITMDASFRVTAVTIDNVRLEPVERTRLESAIMTAVNDAAEAVKKSYVDRATMASREPTA